MSNRAVAANNMRFRERALTAEKELIGLKDRLAILTSKYDKQSIALSAYKEIASANRITPREEEMALALIELDDMTKTTEKWVSRGPEQRRLIVRSLLSEAIKTAHRVVNQSIEAAVTITKSEEGEDIPGEYYGDEDDDEMDDDRVYTSEELAELSIDALRLITTLWGVDITQSLISNKSYIIRRILEAQNGMVERNATKTKVDKSKTLQDMLNSGKRNPFAILAGRNTKGK